MKRASRVRELPQKRMNETRWVEKPETSVTPYKTIDNSNQGRLRRPEMIEDKYDGHELVEYTAQIVSAYVSNNPVVAADLQAVIGDVYSALSRASSNIVESVKEELRPAVAPKKSLTPEYIICLEDGKKFKSLKRHLRTHYNMSPEEYREKWGLEPNYPMVAPRYAEARSNLAKKMGLGQRKGR